MIMGDEAIHRHGSSRRALTGGRHFIQRDFEERANGDRIFNYFSRFIQENWRGLCEDSAV
jgi:hypothetical protein